MGKAYGYLLTNVDVKELLGQVEALKAFGVEEADLVSDVGCCVTRGAALEELIGMLHEGDVVVVPNAGCLGFNLQEIARTWGQLTRSGRMSWCWTCRLWMRGGPTLAT